MQKKYVGAAVPKSDARALTTGQPVYTDDLAPAGCLIVKVLRSPHAHALITSINTNIAKKVPGIECILTYEDVPQCRFTMAGQTFPEPSPYDRLILDRRVRFVGDAVAIVAGETEAAVDKALRLIKVEYKVLGAILDPREAKDNKILIHPEESWKSLCPVGADNTRKALRLIKVEYKVLGAILDPREAKDNKILIHPEESWKSLCPVGADNTRNLCASGSDANGDIDAVLADCDVVLERTYRTKPNQQAMMETFRTYTQLDTYGRLNVISSTQVPFHVRRILSHALNIPKSRIRVVKPRLGGGFGAKQTVVTEVYPAIVTLKTGKPAKIVYSRYESQIASSPRAPRHGADRAHGRDEGRHHPRHRPLYPVEHRRIRRTRTHNGRPVRSQTDSAVCQAGGISLPLGRGIHQHHYCGAISRLRRNPGHFCNRIHGQRTGRPARHRPDRYP